MKKTFSFFIVLFMIIKCSFAQESAKTYETFHGIVYVNRDSFQLKKDWDKSIEQNLKKYKENPKNFAAFYRLSVDYAMTGNLDSGFYYLNGFLDNSNDDRVVVVDPYFDSLRCDTIRWKQVVNRIEKGFLNCLDSAVNKEYALQLFYIGIEDQKYRSYYPALMVENGWEFSGSTDYRNDTIFERLVQKYGFPTISSVGTHSCIAGCAVIQHTTFSKNYKKRYRSVLEAYHNNDYPAEWYAKVVDRWRIHHHQKQLYGTGWYGSYSKRFVKKYGHCYILEPVRNFKKLNARRSALGMCPVEKMCEENPDYLIPQKYYRGGKMNEKTELGQKSYERDLGRSIIKQDSFQRKKDWIASIGFNKRALSDSITTHSYYRLAASFSMIGDLDSAFIFLNKYLDISQDDRCVFVDIKFANLKKDSIRWHSIIDRIEQGYLMCLDSTKNKEYALSLFRLGVSDQKFRVYYPLLNQKYNENDWIINDMQNDSIFNVLIGKYGFPTISSVGRTAASTAFLIIQHGEPKYRYYRALVKAYRDDDFDAIYYAKVKDRWATDHSRKQIYGTSWYRTNETRKIYGEKWVLEPVRNFKNLNRRREEIGLSPIEEEISGNPDRVIPSKYYHR